MRSLGKLRPWPSTPRGRRPGRKPQPTGPYSHAVCAGGFAFVSGQPGVDPATGQVPGDSFRAQARQAFTNLATVFRVADSRPDLVVSTAVEAT